METVPSDQAAPAPPARRRTIGLVVAALTVLVVIALTGVIPGVPRRSGPLEGSGGGIAARLQATDTGILLTLDLQNRSGSPIVLNSAKLSDNPDRVTLLSEPYIRDGDVEKIGSASLPLPDKWKSLPRKKIDGYTITSGRRQEPLKTSESAPEADDYTGGNPQIAIEIARPKKATTVTSVTVEYHIGWQAFRKTFDVSSTVCPPNDLEPCT